MRQRITFLQNPEDSVNPENLHVSKNALATSHLNAAREDRITFGFDELPQELYEVLKASHEIHVRWAGEGVYDGMGPLVSRLSAGLHVFYTAQRNTNSSELLCPLLKKTFGELDCISPELSFVNLPTERFSLSAATQYYSSLPSLDPLIHYIQARLCKTSKEDCVSRVSLLGSATSLDIDFDTISHALTVTAFWPYQTWDLNLQNSNVRHRLEVGVLSVAPPQEPEELSLGGFLTVVGEHEKPAPTLFSFPARHHTSSQKFSSTFIHPTGLHPTLQLKITGAEAPTDEKTCTLHTHLTLPRQIFADKYQLSDPLFLASKNLSAIRYITTPVDLEAPTYAVNLWGSSVLLELAPPGPSTDNTWTAQVPLHLRYLHPNSGKTGQAELDVPYPVVFWACTADEGSKFPINPFDKVNLGYEGLFGSKTMFYHLSPSTSNDNDGGRLVNMISVPVLDLDRSWYVEIGTAVAVLVGFTWICWCLSAVWWKDGYGARKEVGKAEKKEQ